MKINKKRGIGLLLIRMFNRRGDSRIARKQPQNNKRATNGRPYKRISAENLFSLPICVIMGLAKSLSLWERWRRSRRRGQIVATTTLSPAIAGALPKGEPLGARNFRGMGFARRICNTNAKLAINKENKQLQCGKGNRRDEKYRY